MNRRPPRSTRTETRFPYTTLFRSDRAAPWAVLLPAPYSPLDAHRDAHAAADAQGRKTLLRIVLLHLIEQGDQHARARCADRMADRDRAAVDVDLGGVPAHFLVHRQIGRAHV